MAPTRPVSRLELLKGSPMFSSLSDEQLALLADRLMPARFRRNEIIFLKHDPGDALYVICSGRIKISVPNPDGKDLIINIYGPGEVFGEMSLFDGLARSAAATALEQVEALRLSREAFEEVLASVHGLALSIIRMLSRRLRYSTEQTEMIGLFGAYDRVALKLLQLAPATPEGATRRYEVNLSQQELAAMLGLTREWLNKVLKTFADEGVIALTWGKVTVLDADALKRWGDLGAKV
ncbi:MAG TPA: Crp/Fnr family transcriptional regulator [Herpetosiphonaceae bacterium]